MSIRDYFKHLSQSSSKESIQASCTNREHCPTTMFEKLEPRLMLSGTTPAPALDNPMAGEPSVAANPINLNAEWYVYSGGTVTGRWDTLVPGETYKVYLKVTNNGSAAAVGTMDVDAYFHNAQVSPGGPADVMSYDDIPVNLAANGGATYYKGIWTVPANDPSQNWYFVGDVNDFNFAELVTTNTPVVSPVQDLEWGFGANIGLDSRSVSYLKLGDSGNPIYFTTTGGATGLVDYQPVPANGYDIHMTNTTAATSVKVYNNAVISGFDSDGAINRLQAPQSTVSGQVDIGAAGNSDANYFHVGQVIGGNQLNAGAIKYIYTVLGGLDADVNLAGTVGWANISTYVAGDLAGTFDITAGDVYKILVTENVMADVDLPGNLTKVTIYGDAVGDFIVAGNLTSAVIYENLGGGAATVWAIMGNAYKMTVLGNATAHVTVVGNLTSAVIRGDATGVLNVVGNLTSGVVYGDLGAVGGAPTHWIVTGNAHKITVRGNAIAFLLVAGDLTSAVVYGNLGDLGTTVVWDIGGSVTKYVYVKNFMLDSELRAEGSINAVYLGGMVNSLAFAGVNSNISVLPTVSGNFVTNQTISLFKILGVAGVNPFGDILFQGSSVAAGTLGVVSLLDADLGGGASAYGVAYDNALGGVAKLALYQLHTTKDYYIWNATAWAPALANPAGDLAVRPL